MLSTIEIFLAGLDTCTASIPRSSHEKVSLNDGLGASVIIVESFSQPAVAEMIARWLHIPFGVTAEG